MVKSFVRLWVGALVPAVLQACRLQEVTIPLGQEVLVVQGVLTLDTAARAQYIVVERSITGTMPIPDQDSLRGPPRPPLPISGALVRVTRDDGAEVVFAEAPDTAGVYRLLSQELRGFLLQGREYRLLVVTPAGDTVRGRTRMPAFPIVSGIPEDGAVFNRDRDTLLVSWSGGAPTKGVFIQVRPRDLQRRLTFLFFTDSAQFRVAGRLPLPVPSDTLPPVVWIAGTLQTFTVASMDTNFFNYFRTANEPFTGTGFINTVEGGLGVFGAMAPVNRTYVVRGDTDHPLEGRYVFELATDTAADTTRFELDLFVNRDRPNPVLVNGLAPGSSCNRTFCVFAGPRLEASGWVEGDFLHLWVIDIDRPGGPQFRLLLEGGISTAGVAEGVILTGDRQRFGTYTVGRIR